jgi:hypothetical protein
LHCHEFLSALHRLTEPRTYLETGVHIGQSLTRSRVPSIGIDPDFSVNHELLGDIHLARTTSDEFFARANPLAHLPIPVIDLAFIDGMHLAEYALRDYLGVERFTTPASVIVFDDMLPRSIDEAARHRHTSAWTGDVYKAVQALRDFCPELIVFEVDTAPTGVVVVLTPNASRGGVLPQYDDWLEVAFASDPQNVPAEILTLLDSAGWQQLPWLRKRRKAVDAASVRAAFADVLRAPPATGARAQLADVSG